MNTVLLNLADECDQLAHAIVDPVAVSEKLALFAQVARQAARHEGRLESIMAIIQAAYNEAELKDSDEPSSRRLRMVLAQYRAV